MAYEVGKLLIIPDGHRRYADRHGLPLPKAYLKGAETAARIVQGCIEDSLSPRITLYPLARKNFAERSSSALEAIAAALDYFVEQITPLSARGLTLTYRGSLTRLPARTRMKVTRFARASAGEPNRGLTLELLIDYSGTEELSRLTKPEIASRLADPFDIVLRTGGHFRLSDAPPLECFPAEFVTLEKMFPETTYSDISRAVASVKEEYARRDALRAQPDADRTL